MGEGLSSQLVAFLWYERVRKDLRNYRRLEGVAAERLTPDISMKATAVVRALEELENALAEFLGRR